MNTPMLLRVLRDDFVVLEQSFHSIQGISLDVKVDGGSTFIDIPGADQRIALADGTGLKIYITGAEHR